MIKQCRPDIGKQVHLGYDERMYSIHCDADPCTNSACDDQIV